MSTGSLESSDSGPFFPDLEKDWSSPQWASKDLCQRSCDIHLSVQTAWWDWDLLCCIKLGLPYGEDILELCGWTNKKLSSWLRRYKNHIKLTNRVSTPLHCKDILSIKQVRKTRTAFVSLGTGELQPSTGSFVCFFQGGKKGGTVSMGLLLFELKTAKAQETLTERIPGLCTSNTSVLHLIQCQQMSPVSSIVARFLSVYEIFFLMFL